MKRRVCGIYSVVAWETFVWFREFDVPSMDVIIRRVHTQTGLAWRDFTVTERQDSPNPETM